MMTNIITSSDNVSTSLRKTTDNSKRETSNSNYCLEKVSMSLHWYVMSLHWSVMSLHWYKLPVCLFVNVFTICNVNCWLYLLVKKECPCCCLVCLAFELLLRYVWAVLVLFQAVSEAVLMSVMVGILTVRLASPPCEWVHTNVRCMCTDLPIFCEHIVDQNMCLAVRVFWQYLLYIWRSK